ncbi:hypothetical protein BH10PSE17_BH10PSE17_02280 [soil metagenome]
MPSFDELAERWPRLDLLLNQALELPPTEHDAWLTGLNGDDVALRETLRDLLLHHETAENGNWLETTPHLPHADAVPMAGEPRIGDRVGPYVLLSKIGSGGMGAVWLAERADGQLKRQIALKLPQLVWGDALAERMRRERDILASLEHEHIARLYDAGVDSLGRPYLAMEFVDGRPIDAFCTERHLDVAARIGLLLQVADAVGHAHARLVVHRDLKPANILVTPDAQVRLLDFGVAKLMEGDRTDETALTRLSGRALTLDYASPEQIRGEPLGVASDVYSLAVVAYELLTGKRPYRLKRGSAAELEEAIAPVEPLRASEAAAEPAVRQQLRGDLDAILNKALKKNVDERYATVEAFAQDLRRHLQRETVSARPDVLTYRLRKFVSRYRVPVSAGGIVMLALLTGAGIALWQARLAQHEAARALQVSQFFQSVFVDANPDLGAGGREMTAVELLKNARTRLDSQPDAGDPAITVQMKTGLGSSLAGLGENEAAIDVLRQANRLAAAGLAADDPIRAGAQLSLAEVLHTSGVADAEVDALLASAERTFRRRRDWPGVAHTLVQTSQTRMVQGKQDEAIAIGREVVRLTDEKLASPEYATERAAANTTLFKAMSAVGMPGKSEPARRGYEFALQSSGGHFTAGVLQLRSSYAFALSDEGKAVESLAELKAVLGEQIKLLGADHMQVFYTQLVIGHTLIGMGDPHAANLRYREALRIASLAEGPNGYDVMAAHASLGFGLLNARSLVEAESEIRIAERGFAAIDPDHPYLRLVRAALIKDWSRMGKLDDAARMLAALTPLVPKNPREAGSTLAAAGELALARGQFDVAEAAFKDAYSRYGEVKAAGNQAIMLAHVGISQVGAGKGALAIDSLTRAIEMMSQREPTLSPDHAVALTALARARLLQGDLRGAADASQAALAFWKSFDPSTAAAQQARQVDDTVAAARS